MVSTSSIFFRVVILTPLRPLIAEQLQAQRVQACLAVTTVLALEKDPLYTQNTHYFESTREKWLLQYKEIRRDAGSYEKGRPRGKLLLKQAE